MKLNYYEVDVRLKVRVPGRTATEAAAFARKVLTGVESLSDDTHGILAWRVLSDSIRTGQPRRSWGVDPVDTWKDTNSRSLGKEIDTRFLETVGKDQ